jgi:hypothetical protein
VLLNQELSGGDRLITAVHESLHLGGDRSHGERTYYAEWRAYNQLDSRARASAVRHSDRFFHLWGPEYGRHHDIPEPNR